jgi:hypothetical protein
MAFNSSACDGSAYLLNWPRRSHRKKAPTAELLNTLADHKNGNLVFFAKSEKCACPPLTFHLIIACNLTLKIKLLISDRN